MKRLLAGAAIIALSTAQADAQTQISTATGSSVLTSRESSNNFGAVLNVPSTGYSAPGSNAAQARGVVLLSPTGIPYSASSGGGSTGTVTTPSTSGQSTASGQNVNSQNLVYDSANSLWRNWLGDPSGRGYVLTFGSNATAFQQGTAAATASSSNVWVGGATTGINFGSLGSAGVLFGQGASGTTANSQTLQGLGTLGTPAGGVVTIQGGTGGTSVPVSGSGGTICDTTTGILCAPQSSAANRVVTRTAVAATTSTTICPAAANVVATTVFIPLSGTGIGWAGQALTTATPGTANTTPEFATSAANFTWTPLVAPTNLVTAYTATAETIVCVQDVRQ